MNFDYWYKNKFTSANRIKTTPKTIVEVNKCFSGPLLVEENSPDWPKEDPIAAFPF